MRKSSDGKQLGSGGKRAFCPAVSQDRLLILFFFLLFLPLPDMLEAEFRVLHRLDKGVTTEWYPSPGLTAF